MGGGGVLDEIKAISAQLGLGFGLSLAIRCNLDATHRISLDVTQMNLDAIKINLDATQMQLK